MSPASIPAGLVARTAAARLKKGSPYVVAIDGPSGAGKSTIASLAAQELDASVIWSDDFFAAGISDEEWAVRSPAERVRDCIEWRRMLREAIEPLVAGRAAAWHAFDWEAGPRPDGTFDLEREPTVVEPKPVILIDGAYSSRAELSHVVDLSVLVEASVETRRARLAERDGPEHFSEWHGVWGVAETFYFEHLRPREQFDLVVSN